MSQTLEQQHTIRIEDVERLVRLFVLIDNIKDEELKATAKRECDSMGVWVRI